MEMQVTELKEIENFWHNKYPTVSITLWSNDTKYHGRMMAYDTSIELIANSIGELIGQGEMFLRKVTS